MWSYRHDDNKITMQLFKIYLEKKTVHTDQLLKQFNQNL
jgi:hypothetical protein